MGKSNGARDRRLVLHDSDEPVKEGQPGEITVGFESQSHVRPLSAYVEEFLAAIRIQFAYVSNVTKVSDFSLDEADLELASKELGVTIRDDDFVWQIAEKLQQRELGGN